jgi:hypothetical protein
LSPAENGFVCSLEQIQAYVQRYVLDLDPPSRSNPSSFSHGPHTTCASVLAFALVSLSGKRTNPIPGNRSPGTPNKNSLKFLQSSADNVFERG